MSIWGIIIVVIAVALIVTVLVSRGGPESRAARKELRRLRADEKRGPNTYAAAELRRDMYMDPMPGKGTTPGGP